jgi:phosphate transport system protein
MKKFDEEEYIRIKSNIAKMTQLTATQLSNSIKALVDIDSKLAEKIINKDTLIDQLENRVDNSCIKILALYEPKAIDLRFIITSLRIIVDIERIADHCVDIAKEIININQYPPLKPYIDLPLMGNHTESMLKDAINAFLNRDDELAFDVIKRDNLVDNLHKQVIRELLTYTTSDLTIITQILSLMFIAKSLERIGDYSTNICEQVYYMVTGKTLKHIIYGKKNE